MTENWGTPTKDGEEFLARAGIITAPGLNNEEVVQMYNKWAETYDQDTTTSGYYPQPQFGADAVEELLGAKKNALILDAAAGTGQVGEILNKKGYTNIDALDANEKMLDFARQKNVYKNFICDFMGPNKLNIENETYDVVVSVGSFTEGHVTHECFPEMIRITKKGGYFVLPIREDNLVRVDAYRDILEPAMQALEREGLWRQVKRQRVDNFFSDKTGLIFVYQII